MKKSKNRLIKKLCTAGLIIASASVGVATPLTVNMMQAEDVQAATGNEIVNYARQFKGYRYVYGAAGPNSFDCSGLVQYVFKHFGISLPHSSREIYNNPTKYGTVVGYGSTANAKAGDLISWNGHVAIYSENGYCVEALNASAGCGEWKVSSHTNGSNYKVIRVYGITAETPKLKGSPIGGGSQTISDGDYHIVSALNNSMGVDVSGNNSADGTNVNLYSNLNDANQVFTVKYLGNGFYSIRHKSSGKMLDVSGGSLDYGANTHIYSSNNSDAQKWVIKVSNDLKYFYILSKCNGLYLDVESGNASNGTNIRMWGGNGSAAQKWKFIACGGSKTVKDGDYHIVSALDNSMGIDVYGNDNKDGTNIQLYNNASDPNQVFSVKYTGDGYYQLLHKYSGKSIDMYGNDSVSGTNVHLHGSNGSDAQKWILRSAGNGYYSIIGKGSGLFLDVNSAAAANYTNIQGYVGNGTIAQKWKFVPAVVKKADSFSDVKQDDWYYKAVEWAAANGITTGSNGKFFPTKACTREEAITFLWRMQGKPTPKSMNSKYSDVKDKTRYSYKAIMWGTEKGIITGKNGKFLPKRSCTREQIITMLWRLTGSPSPKNMNSKFSDVKNTKSYSYKAILWANQNGISTGGNGKFYPSSKCKRCDIVTFIYRYKN